MKSYPAVNKQIHRKQNLQMPEYNDIIGIHQLGKNTQNRYWSHNECDCLYSVWTHEIVIQLQRCPLSLEKLKEGRARWNHFLCWSWESLPSLIVDEKTYLKYCICNADLDTRENSKQSNIRKLFIKLFLLRGIGHLSNIWIKNMHFIHGKTVNI